MCQPHSHRRGPQLWGRDRDNGVLSIIPGSGRWGLLGCSQAGPPIPSLGEGPPVPCPLLLCNRGAQRCPQALTLSAPGMASGRSQLRQYAKFGLRVLRTRTLGARSSPGDRVAGAPVQRWLGRLLPGSFPCAPAASARPAAL